MAKMAPTVMRNQARKLREHGGRESGCTDRHQHRGQLGAKRQGGDASGTERSSHRLVDQWTKRREHRTGKKRNILAANRGHIRSPATPSRKDRNSQPAHAPSQNYGFRGHSRQGSPTE